MDAAPGLRQRKKERTREAIAETARRLFLERGFDSVTVAEVARKAEISAGTVFNYFPTKEDLFYSQMEVFEERLVGAVRERPSGESVLDAFRRFVLDEMSRLAAEVVGDVIAAAAQVIAGSPALQAREREVVAAYTDALADVIAAERRSRTPSIEPWVVANALMGAHRGLVQHVRASVLTGSRGPSLAADARAQAKRAFAQLEQGLAGYAVRR